MPHVRFVTSSRRYAALSEEIDLCPPAEGSPAGESALTQARRRAIDEVVIEDDDSDESDSDYDPEADDSGSEDSTNLEEESEERVESEDEEKEN